MIGLLLLVACGTSADTAETGDSAETFAPTLTNVQEQVFDKSCAFSTCHGEGGGSGELSLLPGVSHANLVGVASDGDPTQTRVIPADPDNSYLIKKMEGASDIVDDPMPAVPLDADRIQLVRDWIAEGAQDN